MAENGLSERLERIEKKLDQRFTAAQEHFVEQRQYVEFAYDRLDKRMTDGFTRLDQRVGVLDKRMTDGFTRLDQRVGVLDKRMTDGFVRLDQRVDSLSDALARVELKLDQLSDTRSRPTAATPRRARPSKRRR